MALEHLRLEDLSDREVLLVMVDLADGDGYVDPLEMAQRLDVVGDHPRRPVSARLAWLKRWGAVEREYATDDHGNVLRRRSGEPRTTQRYRPTDLGYEVAVGQLRAGQERTLDGLSDGQMLEVTQWLTERSGRSAPLRTLVAREWRYRTQYARGR